MITIRTIYIYLHKYDIYNPVIATNDENKVKYCYFNTPDK